MITLILLLQKLKLKRAKGTRSIISQLDGCKLGFKHQAMGAGAEFVFLAPSLSEGRGQVLLHRIVPPGHAQANETSLLIGWTKFSLRICRYGFSRSECQQGGFPLGRGVADGKDSLYFMCKEPGDSWVKRPITRNAFGSKNFDLPFVPVNLKVW